MNKTNKSRIEVKRPLTQEEIEQRMRTIANLIIDRMYEDKKNNRLMFQSSSNQVVNGDIKRVIQKGSTT